MVKKSTKKLNSFWKMKKSIFTLKGKRSEKGAIPMAQVYKFLPIVISVILLLSLVANVTLTTKKQNTLEEENKKLAVDVDGAEKDYSLLNTKYLALEKRTSSQLKSVEEEKQQLAAKSEKDVAAAEATAESKDKKLTNLESKFANLESDNDDWKTDYGLLSSNYHSCWDYIFTGCSLSCPIPGMASTPDDLPR